MRFEKIPLSEENEAFYLDAYIADPAKAYTRKALLVIPGGGYSKVCDDREGEPIAMAFLPHGYNAFVLHYTVDRVHTFPTQLIEATQAIKHIKDHADAYGIDPDELFVVGFSAGGHLAACTGTMWKLDAVRSAVDAPFGYCKPKGTMLIYPVISGKYHALSFNHLWATDAPTQEQLAASSVENYIDADSSPAFLLQTANDPVVNVCNALTAAKAYAAAGVPFELHVYPNGPHGMALANKLTWHGREDLVDDRIADWVRLAACWADNL